MWDVRREMLNVVRCKMWNVGYKTHDARCWIWHVMREM